MIFNALIFRKTLILQNAVDSILTKQLLLADIKFQISNNALIWITYATTKSFNKNVNGSYLPLSFKQQMLSYSCSRISIPFSFQIWFS